MRIWIFGMGSINLGCLLSEWEAGRTAREFVKRYLPGVHIADVIDGLRRDGFVKKHVRVKYVFDLPNGGGYGAKVKKGGRIYELMGPYPTEKAAYEAMRELLAGLVPAPKQHRLHVSKWVACQRLKITATMFDRNWGSVFTELRRVVKSAKESRVVYRDELEVARCQGGGMSEAAKAAVIQFRINGGRL